MAALDKDAVGIYYTESDQYWNSNELEFPDLNEGYDMESKEGITYIEPYRNSTEQQDDTLKKFIATGVSIVSLIAENLLSHPFIVLRRQCQVHHSSKRFHIFPITLVPVIYHLHTHQGLTTLLKGLGSTLILRSLTLGVEDVLSKITPWPKEISACCSMKLFFQHLLLKSISLTIVMPYYTASLVETVQSDVASEKPGILDVFREGTMRLLNFKGNSKGRMLPIWVLTLPTITFGITRYLFSLLIKAGSLKVLQKQNFSDSGALLPQSDGLLQDAESNASLIAVIASEIVFYPFETVVHRLYLQGTRTIIDNLETGKSVLAILTDYSGSLDCYETCLRSEGLFGFYKGFGALILQYIAHIIVIRVTKVILTEVSIMYKGRKPTLDTTPPMMHNQLSTTSYLIP